MNRRAADRQSGFILATVLVFLVVLTVTAFLAARLTRSDVQVVNNLQNEKEAMTLADAGVHEALYRLSLASGDQATISGVAGGAPFDASITPQSAANSTWSAKIVFTTSGRTATGTSPNQTVTTPSLQLPAQRMLYTNDGSGDASNPTSETLTVEWDRCTDLTHPGCSGMLIDNRRWLPDSTAKRPVVKITSTGRSGNARRTVVVKAIDCVPGEAGGGGSMTTLNPGCGAGNSVAIGGNNTITAEGSIQINAGASTNPPSACTAASTGGALSNITSTGGDINIVGDSTGNYSPAPNEGVLPVTDPYGDMLPPCWGTMVTGCTPTLSALVPRSASRMTVTANNTTLQPGIYYGGLDIKGATNVTFASGVYVMAGGGLTVENNSQNVTSGSGGIMIYNTSAPGFAAASLNLVNGSTTPSFGGITSTNDPYHGVVFFQDRTLSPQPILYLQGGTTSTRTLDGLVYAPNAVFQTQGNDPVTIGGALVVGSISMTGGSDLTIQNGAVPPPSPDCGGLAYRPIAWQDF